MNTVHSSRPHRESQREAALTAARGILEAEGLAALTARRLAGVLGCSVGTLYNLFDSFDALVVQLNLATLAELELALAAAALPGASAEEAAQSLAAAYLAHTTRHRRRWAAVLEANAAQRSGQPDAMRDSTARLVELVEQALAPIFPPEAAPGTARLAAAVLWTGLEGIAALSTVGNLALVAPGADASSMARLLVRAYVTGLATRD
jgi:AcrR family transcriptional regulator